MALTLFTVGFMIFSALWNQGSSRTLPINMQDKKIIPDYNYDKDGTDWTRTCETGERQSPISLDGTLSTTLTKKVDKYYQPLVLVNYEIANFRVMKDDKGFSIKAMSTPEGAKLGLAAGGLKGFYKFVAGYFHWPAEHLYYMPDDTENMTRYSLELQLVHIREDLKTFSDAMNSTDEDAIAILGLLYDVGESNPGIQEVQDRHDAGPEENITATVTFRELLKSIDTFFKYKGSLTHPPCSENVVWIMIADILFVDQKQIDWFYNLHPANSRREQAVGTRDVFIHNSSAKSLKLTGHFIVFLLIIWLLK